MSLGLLTRGYICPAASQIPEGVTIGKGPDIVGVEEVVPDIDHGRQLAPRIEQGEEVED